MMKIKAQYLNSSEPYDREYICVICKEVLDTALVENGDMNKDGLVTEKFYKHWVSNWRSHEGSRRHKVNTILFKLGE